MFRSTLVVAFALVLAAGAVTAQADFLYTQNFTANDGTVSANGASLGADYAGWTFHLLRGLAYLQDGWAKTDGTGKLTLGYAATTRQKTDCADITASQATGGTASLFNVSSTALTVSAIVTGYPLDNYGNLASGLFVGSNRVGFSFTPGLDASYGGVFRFHTLDGTNPYISMGFAPAADTPYRAILTVANNPADSTKYLLNATIKSADGSTLLFDYATATGAWYAVSKSDVGDLDRVSLGSRSFGYKLYSATFSDLTIAQITPEPGTCVLLATGILGLIAYAWRKRR